MKQTIKLEELNGTWKNVNFPLYQFENNVDIVIVFYENRVIVTEIKNKKSKDILGGEAKINIVVDDRFEIQYIENEKKIRCRMYSVDKTPCLIADIEPYGERYFEKQIVAIKN